jgi:hypothetical protein
LANCDEPSNSFENSCNLCSSGFSELK